MYRIVLFSSLLLLQPVNAFAWGHVESLGTEWSQATLTYAVVNRGRLTYCTTVDDNQGFNQKQISSQVNTALRLWLSGSEKYKNIPIYEIGCTQQPDLKVQIGKEIEYPELCGYEVPHVENGRYTSFIKLNTDFLYTENRSDFRVINFASLLPFSNLQDGVMKEVSFTNPMNVSEFAKKFNVSYQTVYLSSYKMLLHELGHAFGLCDTEENLFKLCDPEYKTTDRPPAIMNNADFFYLTPDDKAGIQSLFKRLGSPARSSYTRATRDNAGLSH
jgi:hypothetical protein